MLFKTVEGSNLDVIGVTREWLPCHSGTMTANKTKAATTAPLQSFGAKRRDVVLCTAASGKRRLSYILEYMMPGLSQHCRLREPDPRRILEFHPLDNCPLLWKHTTIDGNDFVCYITCLDHP